MSQPEAAVTIVHALHPEPAVLLMRRTVRENDPWSGQWSFPGGRRDPEDRDSLATALRELHEECGIQLTEAHLERPLAPRLARRATGPYLLVAPFVLRVDEAMPTVPHADETAETVWLPLAGLREISRHWLRPVPRYPANMNFPAMELNGMPLWGFTYRLVTDWLAMFPITPPVEEAGLAVANEMLSLLLSSGMTLEAGWQPKGTVGPPGAPVRALETVLRGVPPIEALLEHFCRPGCYIDRVNLLEVSKSAVRLLGPAFEEYRFTTVA